jgi:hypothetical protein
VADHSPFTAQSDDDLHFQRSGGIDTEAEAEDDIAGQ